MKYGAPFRRKGLYGALIFGRTQRPQACIRARTIANPSPAPPDSPSLKLSLDDKNGSNTPAGPRNGHPHPNPGAGSFPLDPDDGSPKRRFHALRRRGVRHIPESIYYRTGDRAVVSHHGESLRYCVSAFLAGAFPGKYRGDHRGQFDGLKKGRSGSSARLDKGEDFRTVSEAINANRDDKRHTTAINATKEGCPPDDRR